MQTAIQDNNTGYDGTFLMGLITGGAIGVGLALYLSPRLALELRHRATDAATDLQDVASGHLQAVANRVADVVDRVADAAEDVTKRGQAVRDDVADAVSHGAHSVAHGAREVERFAKASKTDHRS